MTEIFLKCRKHGLTHVEKWDLTHDDIITKCGCSFKFNSGYVRNITEEKEQEKSRKYVDDHKGRMYQDGSREFEGIMLQDGSYI